MRRIPLLPKPLALMNQYKVDTELQIKGLLWPVPGNQKMNGYLKEIADICNINKNITMLCTRHTLATLAIEYGMPIDIVANILVHTNVNMTRHYAPISEDNISKQMMRLGKELHSAIV